MNIKKIVLVIILTALLFPGIVQAENTTIGVNINSSDIEAWIDTQLKTYNTPLVLGAGFLYSEDDNYGREEYDYYRIGNVHMAVKDEMFVPGLSLGLGFKGVLGEIEINNEDYDIGAVCFQFLGGYDFRKNTTRLPVSITANLSISPKMLSFQDTDKYMEFTSAFNFHINDYAAAFVGYRIIDIEFDEPVERDWDDKSVFGGIRISF